MKNKFIQGLRSILFGSLMLWPMFSQAQPQPAGHPQGPGAPDTLDNDFREPPPFGGPQGPGFGPPPGSPPPEMSDPFKWPDALDRWKEEDRRLMETANQFRKIETQRNALMKTLTDEKSRYDPERMDTQAMLARQKVNNILVQLHDLVEQDKKNTEEASRLFGFTAMSMKFWGPVFKERLQDEGATLDPKIVQRMRLWVDGYEKSKQQGDPEPLAITLLGEDFGPVVYHTAREHLEKMMGEARMGGRGGPHRGPGRFLKESQSRWIVRIQRLEKRQEDLKNDLDGLGREIERLRQMVESDASWPSEPAEQGKPDEPPSPGAELAPPPPGTPARTGG